MQTEPAEASSAGPVPGLLLAAELQDDLLVAHNDLERLQRLLEDAGLALMTHFTDASRAVAETPHDSAPVQRALAGAVTALQFQDLASQLIAHTAQRLRHCADRLAQGAFDDDEDGEALVTAAPERPNPVTQDEMDAGSIELF